VRSPGPTIPGGPARAPLACLQWRACLRARHPRLHGAAPTSLRAGTPGGGSVLVILMIRPERDEPLVEEGLASFDQVLTDAEQTTEHW
jgi:hypothetical protein